MEYSRGNDSVDDFDEYDPTPYGGGYDLALTYGRPLDPCEEICHPISSTSTSSYGDYERPNYSHDSEANAYGEEALQTEYSSYSRPKPRPTPGYGGGDGQEEFDSGEAKPEPAYGFQPGMNRPSYGGDQPSSEYGTEYGFERPSYEE